MSCMRYMRIEGYLSRTLPNQEVPSITQAVYFLIFLKSIFSANLFCISVYLVSVYLGRRCRRKRLFILVKKKNGPGS
jgi:hypothetical protein